MKTFLFFLLSQFILTTSFAQLSFDEYPVFSGHDLGLLYSAEASSFRLWSPTAEAAELLLFKDGSHGEAFETISLERDISGTWYKKLDHDLQGLYYTCRVKINGNWSNDLPDPYAKAAGANGKRAYIADLKITDPPTWKDDKSPAFSKLNLPNDAVIYELHIRDASINPTSGIQHKGKYAGLVEHGTSYHGVSTGLDHLKEMGVTHVHLLPFFDFNSVDEVHPEKLQYNWGYDPLNYNIPEGSYSSNAANPLARIKELKEMIAAFHRKGLRVVMDVVYNHTSNVDLINFQQFVPGYYFRQKNDGSLSDATACGNETASERPMMRKFILESLLFWQKEYHIDGFRFDLMGVHDIETMNIISEELHKHDPSVLLYGEGWTAGSSPLPDSLRALKINASKLNGIAVFSDDIRDGLKGSVFSAEAAGFISGKIANTESVKFGIVAAGNHPQIDYGRVNYSKAPFTNAPSQVINYASCHDNNTLWDKLKISNPGATDEQLKRMQKLALTIVLTSQGIPFLHAGSEFCRTKFGVENSYKSPDSINAIDWKQKANNTDLVKYVEKLIAIRKAHPAFRMHSAAEIAGHLHFLDNVPEGVIAYTLDGKIVGDSWEKIVVVFNGSGTEANIPLPDGKWKNAFSPSDYYTDHFTLPGYSSVLLHY